MKLPTKRARILGGMLALGAVVAAASAFTGCGSDNKEGASPTATATEAAYATGSPSTAAATAAPTKAPLAGDITVLAAASLTDAFKEAGKAFEAANPGVHVTFSFASSSALVAQIDQGQPGDVFASADGANMKKVTDKNQASNPVVFATNVPVLVVPASGSPVVSFEDLAKPGIKLVLASPAVPIGNYARQILENASATNGGISAGFSEKVMANLKSNEADVRAVLAKVQLGEADAGVVYSTDATVGGAQVKAIAIPAQYNVVAEYPVAVLAESKHKNTASAFVEFLTSDAGEALMQKDGFGKPQG